MNILIDYVREQARWREGKAEEYLDDQRNAQSSDALKSLAEYVGHEDASLNRSAAFLAGLDAGGHIGIGGNTHRLVSRYGFGYPATSVAHHEALLDEMAVAALEDL